MAKLIRIEGRGFMGIKAVAIDTDGKSVVVGGENESGKSCTLRIIPALLGGAKHGPAEPLRKGAKKGMIAADIADCLGMGDLHWERSVGPNGLGTLKITSEEGAVLGGPQGHANKLWSSLSFNPMAFDRDARESPKKAADTLRKLVGLDTTEDEAKEKELRAKRTDVGRETKKLRALAEKLPHHTDAPEAEVSVKDLFAELERRRGINAENREQRRELERQRIEGKRAAHEVEVARQALADLEADLERRRQESIELDATVSELRDADEQEVMDQIATAEEQSKKVRENATRAAAKKSADEEQETWDLLTEEIEAVAATIAEKTAAVEFPIDGLEVAADAVRLDGLPWEQAAMSRRIRASAAIAKGQNPELKLWLVEEGAYLDEKNLALVAELAEEDGGIAMIEVVGREGATVVIEDGEVAETEK
jgi:hypothetical protein